jgi:hypothetical protein
VLSASFGFTETCQLLFGFLFQVLQDVYDSAAVAFVGSGSGRSEFGVTPLRRTAGRGLGLAQPQPAGVVAYRGVYRATSSRGGVEGAAAVGEVMRWKIAHRFWVISPSGLERFW